MRVPEQAARSGTQNYWRLYATKADGSALRILSVRLLWQSAGRQRRLLLREWMAKSCKRLEVTEDLGMIRFFMFLRSARDSQRYPQNKRTSIAIEAGLSGNCWRFLRKLSRATRRLHGLTKVVSQCACDILASQP